MSLLLAVFITFVALVALAIVGMIVSCLCRQPAQLPPDPYLTAYGDQPNAPWAAHRSGTERLAHLQHVERQL